MTPVPAAARPLVVAHRGAWGDDAPQNSVEAFMAAIELGCEMVELDVRRTRDAKLVAIHDARVGATPVSSLDHDELLARLRPGQAPLLEELVELAAGRIGLDVELKESGYVERVMAALARLEPDQYVITSFRDVALTQARQVTPAARTGLLLGPGRRPRRLAPRLAQTGADFLAPHASLARAGLLAWAANRELASFVWTVNEPRALRTMLADPRVTAVITDHPAQALALRDQPVQAVDAAD